MKFKTLREAKKYYNSINHKENIDIYKGRNQNRKYKYIVCTYIQWLNSNF